MGEEDPKLHPGPAPSPRTLPSPQLAQGAGSGQEAMGRPFSQTMGGGGLPAGTATPPPSPDLSQGLNLSHTHRFTPYLLPSLPAQHKGLLLQWGLHRILSQIPLSAIVDQALSYKTPLQPETYDM